MGSRKCLLACRTRRFVFAMLATLTVASAGPASAGVQDRDRTVGDLRVVLGVMPAALLTDHPEQHEEATMHGGLPAGRSYYHVLVALFDRRTGERITEADVHASVGELGFNPSLRDLKRMNAGGVVTFGNFFAMPDTGPYQITVTVRTPQSPVPVDVKFVHSHQ